MRCSVRLLSPALLIWAALAASAALGQSLSIVKKVETNYWIEASAPADSPYVLQASANSHLWADIHDGVQGQFSYRLDQAGVAPHFAADRQRFFRLTPSTPPAPPIVIMLLGDSMTSDCCGWGGGIYRYFKPNVTVVNYAMAWTSTKVFLRSAEWDKMLLVQPNYVLIQYGFVDQNPIDPDRYTTLPEFEDNLKTIVNTVRGFNGVPILVTMHAPRVWDENGKAVLAWQDRNAVTKEVAAALQTPLIDLNPLTMDLLNQLGPAGSQFMELWAGDNMHLSPAGGWVVAQLVVNALPDSLGPYLTLLLDPPPIPQL
jgi:lysophospholipase L1-like esterase